MANEEMKNLLRQEGKFRAETAATLAESTQTLRNWIVSMVNAGEISEVEAARLSGISRNTIRTWLGKK